MYYFAYGSNMSQVQMQKRCPGSLYVGVGVLEDYTLDFTISDPSRWNGGGCADVVQKSSNQVWGVVYKLTETDLENLDKAEGPRYQTITLKITLGAQNIEAFVYEVIDKAPTKPPASQYLETLIRGAEECDLPRDYVESLKSINTID